MNHIIEQDGWMAAVCTFTGRTADGREASMSGSIQARLLDGRVEEAYNQFDFVRTNGTWKILNVTFTRRTTDCPGR